MTERQSLLLKNLIENHIKSAEPVPSGFLANKIDVSSATIRNELVNLEEEGMIYQPHTSAGRIPTVEGYRYYIHHYLAPRAPKREQKELLQSSVHQDNEASFKTLAKALASSAAQAVMVASGKYSYYYTGLSNVFEKPEFATQDTVLSMAELIDQLDDILHGLYAHQEAGNTILLGEDNPFSNEFAIIKTTVVIPGQDPALFAIMGPMRMDYNQVLGLLDYTHSLFNQNKDVK